jgi:hypothetical protein
MRAARGLHHANPVLAARSNSPLVLRAGRRYTRNGNVTAKQWR